MKAELVKRQDRWDLYGEDGSKIASSAPNPFKRLSIKNCEAIEMGYDLDELANKFTEHFNTFDVVKSDIQVGYKKGFNKAMELNKDKLFSQEDMYKMFIYGDSITTAKKNVNTLKNKPLDEFFNDFIQSLQQPTEIEVEIRCYIGNGDKESDSFKDPLVTNTGIPKLDENGCLILRKK
jgi:hypothetical protein